MGHNIVYPLKQILLYAYVYMVYTTSSCSGGESQTLFFDLYNN